MKQRVDLALISKRFRQILYKEKGLEYFDLSNNTLIEEELLSLIDEMCPTMKHLKIEGNMLALYFGQHFEDIICPFRFLTSLRLSKSCIVDDMQFVLYLPFTLKSLDLDRLFQVPSDDIVRFLPYLSDQLDILCLTGMVQLTKYDLVAVLQHFHKLHTLDICDTDYITPGTCATIARYCFNLLEFYFTMEFRMRDCCAWIGLLGLDLQHVVFTELVNDHLKAYYRMEHDMDENGNAIYEDSEDWPVFE